MQSFHHPLPSIDGSTLPYIQHSTSEAIFKHRQPPPFSLPLKFFLLNAFRQMIDSAVISFATLLTANLTSIK